MDWINDLQIALGMLAGLCIVGFVTATRMTGTRRKEQEARKRPLRQLRKWRRNDVGQTATPMDKANAKRTAPLAGILRR
jgi:hypothetical protein